MTPSASTHSFSTTGKTLVKLMKNELSWKAELECRRDVTTACVVPIVSVARMELGNGNDENSRGGGFYDEHRVHVCYLTAAAASRHAIARTFMEEFPYAICMPMAQRSLNEIISQEQLSSYLMIHTRHILLQIGNAINALHRDGIIHGDVKPRNVVRMDENQFMLIDLDMAIRGSDADCTATDVYAAKVRDSSAYASPEATRWLRLPQHVRGSLLEVVTPPQRIDLWSFGVTAYEVLTGVPLFRNAHDSATETAEDELAAWDGLTPAHCNEIRKYCQQHVLTDKNATASADGAGDVVDQSALSAIDLLQWLLDGDVSKRPTTMKDVLDHAFFKPSKGAMREHFVISEIRAGLESNGPRSHAKVMISYCWQDTTFVLQKLALALAPVVEGLWLDRLGGETGMSEWVEASMQRGVAGADVVIAVVSPAYVKSKNCGREMQLAKELEKTIVPVLYGLPFAQWPPQQIGETKMSSQFYDEVKGDKLFIDFSNAHDFGTKFNFELLPTLKKKRTNPYGFSRLESEWSSTTLGTLADGRRYSDVRLYEGDCDNDSIGSIDDDTPLLLDGIGSTHV